MAKRVAIAGGTPAWRRGIDAALVERGYTSRDYSDLDSWESGPGGLAVMASIGTPEEFESLRRFCEEYPYIPIVAILADFSVSTCAAAVRDGATVAIGEDDALAVTLDALEAALEGRAIVPSSILRAMAARVPAAPDASAWVSVEEAEWIRKLAAGETVVVLAGDAGYSEREMFRMLRDMYLRIGVSSRTEAIIWATRHGLLDA